MGKINFIFLTAPLIVFVFSFPQRLSYAQAVTEPADRGPTGNEVSAVGFSCDNGKCIKNQTPNQLHFRSTPAPSSNGGNASSGEVGQ